MTAHAFALRAPQVGAHVPGVLVSGGRPALPVGFLRAGAVSRDILGLAAIVFLIPFVILGVGIPVALAIQLLLWMARSV